MGCGETEYAIAREDFERPAYDVELGEINE